MNTESVDRVEVEYSDSDILQWYVLCMRGYMCMCVYKKSTHLLLLITW